MKHSVRSTAVILMLCFFLELICQPVSLAKQSASVCGTEPALKLIALTFDDGPSCSVTPRLLDGLAERGIHATFFLIGNRIQGNEALVIRMEDEGHQVGIHTYSHVAVTGLNQYQFDQQIGRTRRILTSILGNENFAIRPPFGFVDSCVKKWADAPIVLWSVDPKDWCDSNVSRITSAIVNHVEPGDVILLHDIFSSTVEATLAAVDELLQQGYYFVTVDELFMAYGIPLENGTVYRSASSANSFLER